MGRGMGRRREVGMGINSVETNAGIHLETVE